MVADTPSRLGAVDVLRGFALLGMILVHVRERSQEASGLLDLVGWAVYLLVESKSWATFAFLFGVGFALQLRSAARSGRPFVPTYLRRLAALAMFGIAAEVFFGYHVLFSYALCGLALLLLHTWPTPRLVLAAVVVSMSFGAWNVGTWAYTRQVHGPDAAAAAVTARVTEVRRQAKTLAAAERRPDYTALVAARGRHFWWKLTGSAQRRWILWITDVSLALFILGLLAVRAGFIDDPSRHRQAIRGWMAFGAASWLMTWLVLDRLPTAYAPSLIAVHVNHGLWLIREQWLAFTYIGAVLLLMAGHPVWMQRLSWMAAVGRMPLTNYFVQIAVLDVLTSAYGFGLRFHPALIPVITLAIFLAEVALSRAWLVRFSRGPLEWVWQSLASAARQPLRRPVTSPASA
jgi:uncharacterized protein